MSVAVFVDPESRHHFGDRLFDSGEHPFLGDQILAPFTALRERLTASGYAVHTADLFGPQTRADRNVLISIGIPDRLVRDGLRRYRELSRRGDLVLSAFFAFETPVVEPTLYTALPAFQQLFRRVFSWSDADALLPFTKARTAPLPFHLPQGTGAVHDEVWSGTDRRFLVMINANKLPRLYVNELYTARLRAVQYFQQFGEIDLYGRYWDDMPIRVGKTRTPATLRRAARIPWRVMQRLRPNPIYTAARAASRGPVRSKRHALGQYRFALAFENSMIRGYITEKLFDCFYCGTVPVYWGAPDIQERVPAESFIDMRRFADFAELRRFLHALSPSEIERYREAGRAFLASPRFEPFATRTFVDLVASAVAADVESAG